MAQSQALLSYHSQQSIQISNSSYNATATGIVLGPVDASAFASASLSISGSWATAVLQLQVSTDGTTFTTIPVWNAASPSATQTLTIGSNIQDYIAALPAYAQIQLACTTLGTGTINATMNLSPNVLSTPVGPINATLSGTGSAASSGASATFGAFKQYTASAYAMIGAGTIINIPAADANWVRSVSLTTTGAWTGTIALQYTTDGATYTTLPLFQSANPNSALVTSFTANITNLIANIPPASQIQLICAIAGTGTVNATLNLFQGSFNLPMGVQSVTSNASYAATSPSTGYSQGLRATTTNPAAATTGNMVAASGDKVGRLVAKLGQPRELRGNVALTLTSTTTETTLIAAGGAGVFNDIKKLTVSNSSATATTVVIRDATGAGTARTIFAPASSCLTHDLGDGDWIQATANNNWTATCGTSAASVYIVAAYDINI